MRKLFYITISLIVCFTSCSRDKFCDIKLSNSDLNLYYELSDIVLADKSIVDSYRKIKTESYPEILKQIEKLEVKPISIKKSQNVFTALIFENETWYMESDELNLTISEDTRFTSLRWDGEDKQFLLNCQSKPDENSLLRSITIHN